MKVVPVEPIGVELFWDKIEPLVKKSVTYSGGRHTVATTKFPLFRASLQISFPKPLELPVTNQTFSISITFRIQNQNIYF